VLAHTCGHLDHQANVVLAHTCGSLDHQANVATDRTIREVVLAPTLNLCQEASLELF
jgi:hypothetical protein